MKQREECMIMKDGVCWLQTYGEGGAIRLSHVGPLSVKSVKAFCERVGLALYVDGERKPLVQSGPVASSNRKVNTPVLAAAGA